jgi:hypothetical protein
MMGLRLGSMKLPSPDRCAARHLSFNFDSRNVMTNVRTTRRLICATTAFAVSFCLLAIGASDVQAQGGPMTFSRTPTGGASSVIDSNRQGLGMNFRAGHDAGNTVGRSRSVSHIQLAPYVNIGNGYLFGDSRLIRDNDNGLAWSFGSGYRHYLESHDVVLGINGYFDRDQTTGAHFKSWGLGGEILANDWELRGNYYHPFDSGTTLVGTGIDQSSAVFVGNNIEFSRIDTFAETLKGFDTEVGWLLPGKIAEQFDVRAFGGGYWYTGENIDAFAGWSGRLQADIANWLELSLKLTDDEVTHTNVSFNAVVHFGGFKSQEHTKRSAIQRLAEPVRRNLTIASTTSSITTPGQIAIDPNDGLPFQVVHVNSNDAVGPFIGTVEDPLQSLTSGLAVPGADIVFVHAGSDFNAAPDNTVVLAANQNLFGEGVITSATGDRFVVNTVTLDGIGELEMPSSPTFISSGFTLARPTITSSPGDAVTLNTGSRFGGFIIDGAVGNGIFSDSVGDTIIRDVLVQNVGGSGILLQQTTGTTSIIDSVIQNVAGPAFHVNGGAGIIGFTANSTDVDPAFGAIINSSQEAVLIENMTGGQVNMFRSTIDDDGGTGIVIRDSGSNVSIDNANIQNSTSTGIAITNSTGTYTFRNSLRNSTVIDNATGSSVLVDGVSGLVTFEDLDITNPNSFGIDINNLSGNVLFSQDITIGAAAGGTDAAISVDSSTATGQVQFIRDVTIDGSLGRGIELLNNADSSSFTINGQTTITSAATEGIAILNDSGSALFSGGVSITNRGEEGILVDNADGVISFRGATSVNNLTLAPFAAVDVQNSEALVLFESLTIANATGNAGGGAGVHLVNNITGANGPGTIIINDIDLISNSGVGLFGNGNTLIRIDDGDISSTLAAAVDIENSGIDIDLATVTSTGSPDFGIRLVETNVPQTRNFRVGPATPTALGQGGSVTGAATTGVFLQNAGEVSLRSMVFDDNFVGITVRNSGIADDDDQYLELPFVVITRSDSLGIDSQNLTLLDIQDGLFDDNGDTVAPAESILLTYTEVPNDPDTTLFSEFDNPYTVNIERTIFTDNSDDVISISNTTIAAGAYLDVNLEGNTLTMFDNNDFDPTDLNETAFELGWNGPARVRLVNNTFELFGANGAETQTGMDIQMFSLEDELLLDVVGNSLTGTQPTATGLNLQTFALSSSVIDSNQFDFDGDDGTGMNFRMGTNTLMAITNNQLRFDGDGGAGIIFNSVTQPGAFIISGNQIGLFDNAGVGGGIVDLQEEGIRFRAVAGTINLSGANNNLVFLLNPGGGSAIETVFSFAGGTPNGQILVNGVLVP